MPFATVNGITIHYEVQGRGVPLVLISGFGGGMESWVFQVPLLRTHFQLIRFENRGIGKTDSPPGPYTMTSLADDVIGLLDHLGIECANILGISMGGMVAQEIAINHPARVLKLVLASTYACQDDHSGLTSEYEAAVLRSGRVTEKGLYSFAFNNPWLRFLIRKFASKPTERESKVGCEGQESAIMKHNTLDRLHVIEAPTLVMVGTKDRLIRPSSSDVIASSIPHAKLVRIEGGSHALNVEKRKEFNSAVLSFLSPAAAIEPEAALHPPEAERAEDATSPRTA